MMMMMTGIAGTGGTGGNLAWRPLFGSRRALYIMFAVYDLAWRAFAHCRLWADSICDAYINRVRLKHPIVYIPRVTILAIWQNRFVYFTTSHIMGFTRFQNPSSRSMYNADSTSLAESTAVSSRRAG